MSFIECDKDGGITTVRLSRGKVNAVNEEFVDQLHELFLKLRDDDETRAVILTGKGKFFSFGFDIPEFMSYSKDSFMRYLGKFSALCELLFLFPKPVTAALNGHTIAGGCMLAIACDYRIMVSGKAKISLNEISFGSSVFAGSTAILTHCVGVPNAEKILYSGAMYSAEEALRLGLVDGVVPEEGLAAEALRVARDFANKSSAAFVSIKKLLRGAVGEEIRKYEEASLREFTEIWYSEETRHMLQQIKITS